MKKVIFLLFILCCSVMFPVQSQAINFSLAPSTQSVSVGESVFLDLEVSGLTDGAADSLAAFSLNVNFDDSILSFDNVVFGGFLGDISAFEADAFLDDSLPGTVYMDEVSWLFDFELDAIQPASFTLATLEFTGIGIGISNVALTNVVASDAFAVTFTGTTVDNAEVTVATAPVPEPATIFLLGTGLLGIVGFKRKNKN